MQRPQLPSLFASLLKASAIVGAALLCACPTLGQVSQNFLKDSQPVYELGVGAVAITTPNYPGADNNQLRGVPFPFFIYRGRFLRSDDEGTRARLLSSKVYEVGISFGFNFPIKADENPIRQGMPDLDSIVSLGPRFLVRLISDHPRHRLNASVGVRGVFSTNFKSRFRSEGIAIVPALSYWHQFKNTQTTLFSTLSFDFGSAKRNRFFYNVDAGSATLARPRYLAKSGLTEASLSLGFGQNFIENRAFIFAAASLRNLDASANIASPLIQARNNSGLIVGFVWTFYESEAQVERVTDIGL